MTKSPDSRPFPASVHIFSVCSLLVACSGEDAPENGGNGESVHSGGQNNSSSTDGTPGDGGSKGSGDGSGGKGPAAGGAGAEGEQERVPVFLAHGHGFQTIMSCDDGKTWVNNRFETTELTGSNWGHDATSVRGLAYGAGVFVAASGWGGGPTRLIRSTNGVDWEVTFAEEKAQFWSGTFADGHFFFFERKPAISGDGALTWSEPDWLTDAEGQSLNLGKHGRVGFGQDTQLGKRWVTFGADDGNREAAIAYSSDLSTWSLAARTPETDACLKNPNEFGPVFGNGVFLIASNSKGLTAGEAPACISSDGGASWSAVDESFHSEEGKVGNVRAILFHAGQFWAFTRAREIFTSNEGTTWTLRAAQGVPSARRFAVNRESGAWVAVAGDAFYRSDDGFEWSQVAESAIEHAELAPEEGGLFQFGRLVFGYAQPSEQCPLDE